MKTTYAGKSAVKLVLVLLVSCASLFVFAPRAEAILDIRGSWRYWFGAQNYTLSGGAVQGGRYRNLGGGTYEYGFFGRGTSGQNYLYNLSRTSTTGSISMELWLTPSYNGASGFIKMTRGLSPLRVNGYYQNLSSGYGYARLTWRYGYNTIKAVRYTGASWVVSDSFPFGAYFYDN